MPAPVYNSTIAEGQIRLLILHAGQGSDPVSCNLCDISQPVPEWFSKYPALLFAAEVALIMQKSENDLPVDYALLSISLSVQEATAIKEWILQAIAYSDYVPLSASLSFPLSVEEAFAVKEWTFESVAQLLNNGRPDTKHISGRDVAHRMGLIVHHRRLIISEIGYVGLAHPVSQANDRICIVLGGKVPHNLRKTSEQIDINGNKYPCHQMIDDSYIQGLMQGEAMDMVNLGTVTPQMFYLV